MKQMVRNRTSERCIGNERNAQEKRKKKYELEET